MDEGFPVTIQVVLALLVLVAIAALAVVSTILRSRKTQELQKASAPIWLLIGIALVLILATGLAIAVIFSIE